VPNPDPTPGTLESLRLESIRLRQGLVARNTVLGYRYDVQMYTAWCEQFRLPALPTTPETLALYLTDLLSQGKKITTARRRKCAIVHEHRTLGLPSPASVEVMELLRGAQRLRGEKPRQMRPVTVPELRRMSAQLARLGTAAAMRNRALLVVGFASALRRSTLGALTLADVEFCSQGLILHIERDKEDQNGVGRLVGLVRGQHPDTDPVRVLRDWLRVRGTTQPGPLFPRLDPKHEGLPLDGQSICRVVKKALMGIQVDPIQSGAHSLRSGAVTALAEANVSTLRISAFTGQSPEIVRRYFRRSEIWRNNAGVSLGL
jgi:site-specific recombinase XerD